MRLGTGVRRVPGTRYARQLAIQSPGPAVKRALQLRRPSRGTRSAQLRAAMHARVDMGLDAAITRAHHDDGRIADVVDDPVTHLGDMFLAAGPLPGPAPHLLHLPIEECLAG